MASLLGVFLLDCGCFQAGTRRTPFGSMVPLGTSLNGLMVGFGRFVGVKKLTEEGCDGLCDFLVQIGCSSLVCVVNAPVVQDQISSRGQKILFLASTVISRLVSL